MSDTGVFLDVDTVDRGDLDRSVLERSLARWRWFEAGGALAVPERLEGAEVAVTNKVRLHGPVLEAAPQLRLVCVAATGTNNVDLEAARRQGITVCNATAYATPSVVQHVFALMLALTTRLPDYTRAVAEGRWQASAYFCVLDYPIRELAGKSLGIVGYGELGQAVARLGRAFDMQVLVAQRPGGPARPGRMPLDELLARVDVLSLHCPLTARTRGLIGERELALMAPSALLINTARGAIVDEAALAAALRAGRLAGAGVDVLSSEPPAAGNALLEPGIPNLILTPHVAWASREARQRLLYQVAANIDAFRAGRPRNVVS